jgi:hypothetical protein
METSKGRLNGRVQGRWLTPDPLGGDVTNPQSLNRYAYALNNPTTFVDPLGLIAVNTNGGDNCAYASTGAGDASCSSLPGLWNNGQPIWIGGGGGGSVGGGVGGSTTTGAVGGAGGLSQIGPGSPGLGFEPGVDTIEQTAPYWSPWVIEVLSVCAGTPVCQDVLLGAAAGVLVYKGVQAGIQVYESRKGFPTVQDLQRNCRPGARVEEPSRTYPGGTSIEQEYVCTDGIYTVHWIEQNGRTVHGPHIRPGPPRGGGGIVP